MSDKSISDLQRENAELRKEIEQLRAQPARQVGGDFNWLLGLIDEECRYWHGRGDEARRSVCANLLAAAGESPQVNFEIASAASQAGDDYRALECAKKVMALVYGPTPIGGSCQLLAQVQCLIIEALAPAAVVMPERKPIEYGKWRPVGVYEGFNAALDEVARLNRREIPAGLLERVEDLLACPQSHTRPEYIAAAAALRALLGKD